MKRQSNWHQEKRGDIGSPRMISPVSTNPKLRATLTWISAPQWPWVQEQCIDKIQFSEETKQTDLVLQCLEECLYLHILEEAKVTCWPYWMPTMARIYPIPCGTEEEYKRIWLVSGKLLESDIDDQQLTIEEGNVGLRETNERRKSKTSWLSIEFRIIVSCFAKGTEWGMLWPEKILQEECTHCARACRRKQFESVARNGAIITSGGAFVNIILSPDFQYHSEIWAYEFHQFVSDFGEYISMHLII